MSKYTTELRYICESYAGVDTEREYVPVDEVIKLSREKIFNFDYPIFDETYRATLETKIIKHYYTREIGSETVGRWKLWLDTTMNEIMPYYNELYKSTLLSFNPMYDTDLTTTRTNSATGSKTDNGSTSKTETVAGTDTLSVRGTISEDDTVTKNLTLAENGSVNKINAVTDSVDTSVTSSFDGSTSENKSTSDNNTDTKWNYYSDTPQGGVSKIDVSGLNYLTNVTKDTVNNSATGTVTDATTETNERTDETNSERSIDESGTETKTNTTTDTGTVSRENEKTENRTNTNTRSNETESVVTDNLVSSFSNTDEYVEHVVGKSGGVSFSKALLEFRKTIVNIDKQVIDELGELFFGLW